MSNGLSISFLDTFSTDQFTAGYEFSQSNDHYSLMQGWLKISAHPREDLWEGKGGSAPLMLRSAPANSWYWAETYVSADPTGQAAQFINTQIGLFVFQDLQNWIFFGLTHHDFTLADGIQHLGDGFMVTKTAGGVSTPVPIAGTADPAYPTLPLGVDSTFLRVTRLGNIWRFYWKLHRDDPWNYVTSVDLALGDHKIGMGVKTFNIAPAGVEGPGQASFDFFSIGKFRIWLLPLPEWLRVLLLKLWPPKTEGGGGH